MIRRLIILLLIVGCVFGDTIKWQDAKGKTYEVWAGQCLPVDLQKKKSIKLFYIYKKEDIHR